MARSIKAIKLELTIAFMAKGTAKAYGFAEGAIFENEFSKVSLESVLFDIFAFGVFVLESIFDRHKKKSTPPFMSKKSGTPRWYRNMTLGFQFGFDLLEDSDKFDNTGFTSDQIEASKIIKYCSVKESIESNRLTIKVAGESGDDLIPLQGTELIALKEFLAEIKYAGVKINVVNNPADKLLLNMTIYRDVLVIDENGNSIINGGKPVETAIHEYMKALPFDGELVLNDLIAKLRAVDGVNNAHIINATSSAYNSVTDDYLYFMPINVKTIPVAGYFEIVNFDTVTYVV